MYYVGLEQSREANKLIANVVRAPIPKSRGCTQTEFSSGIQKALVLF